MTNTMENITNGKYTPIIKRDKDNKIQYRQLESHLIFTVFRNDLFEEFDIVNHPKAQKCFDLAWQRGHSSGLHEVYGEFEELVELIK